MSRRVRVRVRTRSGIDFSDVVDAELTVSDLKHIFETRLDIEHHQQRVLFNASLCDDDSSLETLGFQDGDVLWIEGGSQETPAAVSAGSDSSDAVPALIRPRQPFPRNQTEPSLPNTGSAIGNATMPLPQSQSQPTTNMFSAPASQPNPFGSFSNPFMPAFGAQQPQQPFGSAFPQFMNGFNLNPTPSGTSGSQQQPNPFGSLPGLGGMGSNGQQPFDMSQLMQNPAMRSMMESMTNNPEIFRNLFNSNPAFQRILEENPQLRHMLNDDQLFQTAMRAAQDPEYYNEMLRSNDRALQNIESLPGGFSALSKMYNQIQRPMEDAMDDMYRQRHGGRPRTVVSDVNTTTAPTREQMPNPWAQNGRAPPVARPSRRERQEAEQERLSEDERPRRRDPALVSRVMDDEEQKAAVYSALSNPDSLRAIVDKMIASNPELKERIESNPELQQLLTDPRRMSQLVNPTIVEQLKAQAAANEQRMKELYAAQLRELVESGFCNEAANLAALAQTNGDVEQAIFVLAEQLAEAEDA